MKKKTVTITESSARALLTKRKSDFFYKEVKEEDIDYTDIPRLTEKQMGQFKPRFPRNKAKSK